MKRYDDVLVTGGSGLVGNALRKIIPTAIFVDRGDYDLRHREEVMRMYNETQPDRVIHLAAKVGGIIDNVEHQANYFDDNVLMNTLVVKYAKEYRVSRFLGILSSCVFPDNIGRYPIAEESLHNGAPAITNFAYAISKRAMATQIDAYNGQYGTEYNYVFPCNLFGETDKDDEVRSHFVTALIKKIYEANKNGDDKIILYGDGTPLRQFMYAGDFARIIKIIIDEDITESFNVVTRENLTIREIAEIALQATKSEHLKLEFDATKPNGQYRKDLSTAKFDRLIPDFKFTSLAEGIFKTYRHYEREHSIV
jgi:GDP-L-fucose synthase